MSKTRKKNTEDDDFKLFGGEDWIDHAADAIALIIAAGIGIVFFFLWIVWPIISFGLATGGGFLAGILRSLLF